MKNTLIETAKEVYKDLGPGHTEAIYETAMVVELSLRDVHGPIARQVPCPIYYKGFTVGIGYIDILVENIHLMELKTVTKLTSKEESQIGKYLQALKLESGLLVNFGPELEIMEVLLHGKVD